ncbi:cytidine deaminase [Enterovibrio norvegicus]|uniref:cytidine deaminase n=1 Tax=Enterovibrio norvegicus TaxID=188144 RepID=UPI000C85F20B|nr:cytidine deaminase [Enterovibrio norvegicus]PMI31951.1 cytidine deaminase [Enterovibrio norvegicus]TKF15081.1 cytidine deaminase [Enterovibrio norvegicus]
MRASVLEAIHALPAPLNEAMLEIAKAPQFDATISADAFDSLKSLSGLSDADLRVALLPVAAAYSVAPISTFYVGAIARGNSGRLYFGANMEFEGVQLNQSVHAEQSAISHAWIKGETSLKDITINYSPCGHCRQFMNELNGAEHLEVQLPQREARSLHSYLPEPFGPSDLGINEPLLAAKSHGLSAEDTCPLTNAAILAANMSHAPYTNNFCGVAIRDKSGQIFSGMYAENAAFNPSLPPLQVALIAMNLADVAQKEIEEVMLVENANSSISYLQDTQGMLEALNPDIPLSYLAI